jgi:VCBS repeat-containing protein
VTASTKTGTYGTLAVEQDGSWTYALNNASTALQGLAEGQTDQDTFQVTVTDEYGATDTESVSVTVTGTNDAPTLVSNPSVTRDLVEDGETPNLTAAGLTFFNDVDLQDTHTLPASLTSAVLSSGDTISPALAAALEDALTTTLLDPATGDGSGQYHWDFVLANDLVQFLATGETLTATYNIEVADNHGLSAIQTVTINIAGLDEPQQAPMTIVEVHQPLLLV